MTQQGRLFDLPVDEEAARQIAFHEIRERLGSIPTPGHPRQEDDDWVVPILVRFPRAIYHAQTRAPERMRFMEFGELGRVVVDRRTGDVVERTQFYDLQRRIQEKLSGIRTTVEKAIVKSSAEKFARMSFPEHMHSPIIDLLSWVMIHGEISVTRLESLVGAETEKYLGYMRMLEQVGLLELTEDSIVPTSYFIEIESRQKPLHDKLTDTLSFYFSRGYERIDSVRQFVGPQLTVTGFIFEVSLESEEPTPTLYPSIETSLLDAYKDQKKALQLPRYLAQLEGVELLDRATVDRERAWQPSAGAFQSFMEERSILEPVMAMMASA